MGWNSIYGEQSTRRRYDHNGFSYRRGEEGATLDEGKLRPAKRKKQRDATKNPVEKEKEIGNKKSTREGDL